MRRVRSCPAPRADASWVQSGCLGNPAAPFRGSTAPTPQSPFPRPRGAFLSSASASATWRKSLPSACRAGGVCARIWFNRSSAASFQFIGSTILTRPLTSPPLALSRWPHRVRSNFDICTVPQYRTVKSNRAFRAEINACSVRSICCIVPVISSKGQAVALGGRRLHAVGGSQPSVFLSGLLDYGSLGLSGVLPDGQSAKHSRARKSVSSIQTRIA